MNNNTSNNELRNNIISALRSAPPYAGERNGMKNIINAQNVVETSSRRWKQRQAKKQKHIRPRGKKKGSENPSRLNNVGNLLMLGTGRRAEQEGKSDCFAPSYTYVGALRHILRWCIALLLFGTHITSGITIFSPLCVAFALDSFFSLHFCKGKHKNIHRE